MNNRPRRRVTLTNHQGRLRLDRLRRRLAHLQQRIDKDPAPRSHDVAEASALAWAIERLERFARLSSRTAWLRRLAAGTRRRRESEPGE